MSYKTELSSNNTDLQTILEMILALGLVDKPYLEFTSASPFTMSVGTVGWDGAMEYDNGNGWATWDGSEISSGEESGKQYIHFRGSGNTKVTGSNKTSSYKWTLTGTNIECNGNIENLLDYTTVQSGNHPTMVEYCYYGMFYKCTSLITAPKLPATTLVDGCYGSMFRECTSLITAPELPATTLTSSCYSYMFGNCTSLITAPELPATTLASRCYGNMFQFCSNLPTAPELPATTLTEYCYTCMFYGCTSLTTAPELPATTLADSCYDSMFTECTSLTIAPELPATTLANSCYGSMFGNCTSLTTVPALPATTLVEYCYYGMFYKCTSLKLSATNTGAYTKIYRIPTSGTGTTVSGALTNMFTGTGGTFAGTPTINTTYYLDESNIII